MKPWLIALALLSLFACGAPQQKGDNKHTFRYNLAAGLTSLDPAFAKNQANIWATNHLYNGLVQLDSELMIKPALAHSWDISEDGKTYTFFLRDDVLFHEDACFTDPEQRKVTANDVVYSLSRIVDPEVASPGAWIFNNKVDPNNPFEAVDDTTIAIHLLAPFRPLLGILTMQYCSVVPEEAVAYYGKQFRSHPVGTGPFTFKQWIEEEGLILQRNENYFEATPEEPIPYVKQVEIAFIDNKGTEFLAFLDGSLDFVSDIDPGLKDLVLTLNGGLREDYTDKVQLIKAPYLNTEYLGILQDSSLYDDPENPLLDVRIRQAINYGFNRADMIRFLRNNKGIPATKGMVPAGLPSFASNALYGYDYQPDKAKKLLAEAGFPNGQGLPLISLYAPPGYMDLCEFIQGQLLDIGIELKLEVAQPAILRSRMEKGEAAFFRASWIADYPDAESYLALFYSGYGAPPNYTRFSDAVVDSLYALSVATKADSVRLKLHRAIDSLVMAQAPVVPLYYDEVLRFAAPNVKGLGVNAMNLLDLRYVRKE